MASCGGGVQRPAAVGVVALRGERDAGNVERAADRVGHARGEGGAVGQAPPVHVHDQRVRGPVRVVDPVHAERRVQPAMGLAHPARVVAVGVVVLGAGLGADLPQYLVAIPDGAGGAVGAVVYVAGALVHRRADARPHAAVEPTIYLCRSDRRPTLSCGSAHVH